MLRSTKKEVKTRIRQYILDRIDFTDYDKEPKNDTETIILCYEVFKAEYVNAANLRRYGSEHRCFTEWLCGVPSIITIDFSYYDARQLVKAWLEQTEEEAERYDDLKVWEYFLHLIQREFFAMLEKAQKGGKL